MTAPAAFPDSARPRLARGIRLQWDDVRSQSMLLFPEGALELNETAAKVLELCDGERTVADVVGILEARYPGADVGPDVKELLGRLEERRFVTRDGRPPAKERP